MNGVNRLYAKFDYITDFLEKLGVKELHLFIQVKIMRSSKLNTNLCKFRVSFSC